MDHTNIVDNGGAESIAAEVLDLPTTDTRTLPLKETEECAILNDATDDDSNANAELSDDTEDYSGAYDVDKEPAIVGGDCNVNSSDESDDVCDGRIAITPAPDSDTIEDSDVNEQTTGVDDYYLVTDADIIDDSNVDDNKEEVLHETGVVQTQLSDISSSHVSVEDEADDVQREEEVDNDESSNCAEKETDKCHANERIETDAGDDDTNHANKTQYEREQSNAEDETIFPMGSRGEEAPIEDDLEMAFPIDCFPVDIDSKIGDAYSEDQNPRGRGYKPYILIACIAVLTILVAVIVTFTSRDSGKESPSSTTTTSEAGKWIDAVPLSSAPSSSPSFELTTNPSTYPTTVSPTNSPSMTPTELPSTAPTVNPTPKPTNRPTPQQRKGCITNSIYDEIDRDIEQLKNGITDERTKAHILGGIVRLVAHDFMDYDRNDFEDPMGPDGCFDPDHPANAGLPEDIWCSNGCLLTDLYEDKYVPRQISRADFWVASANAVIRQTSVNNALDLRDTFAWGRKDANSCSGSGPRLPSPRSCSQTEDVFLRRMGLTWTDAAALMGAHTLGRGDEDFSGHHGTWVSSNNEAMVFDKAYYEEVFLNSWRPRNIGTARENWTTGDGEDRVMLNTDLCLVMDIDDNMPCCTSSSCTGSGSGLRRCPMLPANHPRSEAYDAFEEYLGGSYPNDNQVPFYNAFRDSWRKATKVGQNNLSPLTDNCDVVELI